MGLLRFFLAFCVVNVHGNILGFNLFPADAAVQSFYVISGFYMAMVLNGKYSQPGITYFDFLLSRAFRIGPAYFLIFSLTVATGLVSWIFLEKQIPPLHQWTNLYSHLSPTSTVALIAPQFSIFILDFVHFFTLDNFGNIIFTSNFSTEPIQLWKFLAVPQAWSLAVEIYFYCLAPFIVKRSARFILFTIVFSFMIRVAMALLNDRFDPWSYRFFPSELMYFLCGSMAYKLSESDKSLKFRTATIAIQGFCFLIIISAGMIGRYGLGGRTLFFSPIAIALLFLTISSLFNLSKNIKIDRYIGELSYPLYISHMLIIWVSDLFITHGTITQRSFILLGSITSAILIYELLDKRIDDFRHALFSKKVN